MAEIGEVKRSPATVWELEWSIPAFASLTAEGYDYYMSPSFEAFGESCNLTINPNRNKLGYVYIRFDMSTSKKLRIVSEVSFAIKNADGNKVQERHDLCQSFWPGRIDYVEYSFISRAELLEQASELMPSNTLTVICTVRYTASMDGKIGESGTSTCTYCKELLYPITKFISFHEKNCWLKPVKCPECSMDLCLGTRRDHVCQSTKKAGETGSAKCTHCQEFVDTESISHHENKCLNKPIKCPDCSEVVALKNWYDHKCRTTKPDGKVRAFKTSAVPHVNNALNDFKELFLQKEDCDVVLKVKDQDFPAHKNILKARSAVFASNFRTDMKEKATGVVEIDDCDPFCFSDFLCFLYCADVSLISQENVFGLFTAADKYNVLDLREKCMEFMKENLSVDTFCDTMTVALLHLETELIELATDFFTKNAPDIILTVNWQVFLAENPTQCNELFVKLLKPGSSGKK